MTTQNDQTEATEANRLAPNDDVEKPQHEELEIGPPLPVLRLKLDPPLEYDGEKYKELLFDFDSLIGKDFQRAEREFTHRYKPEKNEVVVPEMKQLYRAILAAHTADVPVGVIEKLPGRYYVRVLNEVLKLYGSSLEEEKV